MKRRNKIVQEIRRNVANVFTFYAIIAIEHGFSMHYHSPDPLGGVFNTSHGTWRMLMHEKPCLIPILQVSTVAWQHKIYMQAGLVQKNLI